MGNYLSCGVPIRVSDTATEECCSSSAAAVRVLHEDGSEEELCVPVSVAELMLEYPSHFVCHASSSRRPLPADHQLCADELYVLLPMISSNSNSNIIGKNSKNSSNKNSMSAKEISVSRDFVDKLMSQFEQQQELEEEDENAQAAEQRLKLMSLRCTSWRPKLATIDERIY